MNEGLLAVAAADEPSRGSGSRVWRACYFGRRFERLGARFATVRPGTSERGPHTTEDQPCLTLARISLWVSLDVHKFYEPRDNLPPTRGH